MYLLLQIVLFLQLNALTATTILGSKSAENGRSSAHITLELEKTAKKLAIYAKWNEIPIHLEVHGF